MFTRDVANITMDLNGVEQIHFHALGRRRQRRCQRPLRHRCQAGRDRPGITAGSGIGDGQADTVTVNATPATINHPSDRSGPAVVVDGLSAQVTVTGAEAANDLLVINGLGGNDTMIRRQRRRRDHKHFGQRPERGNRSE